MGHHRIFHGKEPQVSRSVVQEDDTDAQDRATVNASEGPSFVSRLFKATISSLRHSFFGNIRNYLRLRSGYRRAAQTGWNGMKLLLGVLNNSSDAFPPLKCAAGGVVALIDIFERAQSNDSSMKGTAHHIDRLLGLLAGRLKGDRDTVLLFVNQSYVQALTTQLAKLEDMQKEGWLTHFLNGTQEEREINGICQEIERTLQELQLSIGLSLESRAQIIQHEVVQLNLKRAKAAVYTAVVPGAVSRRSCTPGTRDVVISDILDWAQDDDENAPPIYWISGLAGQGKTTIAHTICERLDKLAGRRRVISFFCSRQLDTAKEALLVSTLALQLAQASESYASELDLALHRDRSLGDQDLAIQMSELLVGPWNRSANHRVGLYPIVVVVDALDENEAGSKFIRLIIAASREAKLPGLRIMITSRPEPSIVHLCDPIGERVICRLNDVPRYLVHEDILQYLKTELPNHRDEHYLVDVAKASASLFVYASTTVRIVKSCRGRRTTTEEASALQRLANRATAATLRGDGQITILDALYEEVVSEAFDGFFSDELDARKRVLLTIVCSTNLIPHSLPILAYCADAEEELVLAVVESLYAVLYIQDDSVFWHHASFQDYILKTYETLVRPTRARSLCLCLPVCERLLELAIDGRYSEGEVDAVLILQKLIAGYQELLKHDSPASFPGHTSEIVWITILADRSLDHVESREEQRWRRVTQFLSILRVDLRSVSEAKEVSQ